MCASEEFVGTYRLRSKVEYLVADPARCRSGSLRPDVVVCGVFFAAPNLIPRARFGLVSGTRLVVSSAISRVG